MSNEIVEQFQQNSKYYNACVDQLLMDLSDDTQQDIFEHLLVGLDDEQKKKKIQANQPRLDCTNYFINHLYSFCVDGVPPESSVLTAIFQARKDAGKNPKDDAELLAIFLYEQLSFLRKLKAPIVDREKNILRAVTRTDMKAFIDQTMAYTGIADEHKKTVYKKINALMRQEDTAIIEARTNISLSRASLHETLKQPLEALKKTLVSAAPDTSTIATSLQAFANYKVDASKTPEEIIDKTTENLSKLIFELHDEPFMQDNGFARAHLYNGIIDILERLDENAIASQMAEEQKKLRTGWFKDIFARFSMWSGYRRYRYTQTWLRNKDASIEQLITKINAIGKADLNKREECQYITSAKTIRQSFLALHSARVAKNRNRTVNKLRPTLLALGSMTSLSFAIMALLGMTGVAFFGLVLFSNPFVLPSIVIAFAGFSLIRALYHLSNNTKLELDREINLEHDTMVYQDYESNPNTHLDEPSTWPAVSWTWKHVSRFIGFMTQNINNKWANGAIALFIVVVSLPVFVIAALPDLVYKLGLKLKNDHKNMANNTAKSMVNYLPILCVVIAVGFVLNHFLPGFFDFATGFNVSDTLTPGTHNAAQSFFAGLLPMMAFGAVSMLGDRILRWGWTNNSKSVTFLGNVLSKTGASLTKIALVLGAVNSLRFVLPFIPPLPSAVVGVALSLTALVVVFVGSVCTELYTNFIDTRRSNKPKDSEHLQIEPGLYALPKPTSYDKFEKKSPMMEKMTPMLDNLQAQMPGHKPKKPDADINVYYKPALDAK